MPWQETCAMDQKVQFIAAYQQGAESMAELCRQFGVSRKTGYKWVGRYAATRVDGLKEQSRARHTQAHQTPAATVARLVALKGQHPTWGPKKLVQLLRREVERGDDVAPASLPAVSTAGAVLRRHGLVQARRRHPQPAPRTQPPQAAATANQLWCADFKGQFRTGDGQWCYPLTITDAASRYLLRCQALTQTSTAAVQPLFELTFREWGLPAALRTDNGPPFASTGLGGLTPLSVWWLKLGIRLDRIDPGKPQQNGRHERMHRVLAEDTARPPAATLTRQQGVFDHWRQEYNHQRPHEALAWATPAERYQPAIRVYPGRAPEVTYPDADQVRRVRPNGTMRWGGREVMVTQALAGEPVGLRWLRDGQWEVRFGPLVLAVLDELAGRLIAVCDRRPAVTHGDADAASPQEVLPM